MAHAGRAVIGGWRSFVKINQVNFSYNRLEDRLLFRFNTQDKTEFRMWLTRAVSIKLLENLRQLVKVSLLRETPGAMAADMEAIMEFRREAVMAKADYAQSFSAEAEMFPLGAQPQLVSDVVMDTSTPVPVVTFQLASGQAVSLSLNHDLGFAISKLLAKVAGGLDWGMGSMKELPLTSVSDVGEKMMLH